MVGVGDRLGKGREGEGGKSKGKGGSGDRRSVTMNESIWDKREEKRRVRVIITTSNSKQKRRIHV